MIIRRKSQQPIEAQIEEQEIADALQLEETLVPAEVEKPPADEFELVDVSTVEFQERLERRRGDRRRGYRRIDERTLVSRAQEEAQSIRELAAAEGYKEGLAKAGDEIAKIKTSLEDFLSVRYQVYEEFSDSLLELGVEVAKKIIKKEVELSDDVLKHIIISVFDEISVTEQKVTIKVQPDELDFAKASLPEILSATQTDAKVIVVPDENIEKGSCTIYTNNGVIDANFSTQLDLVQSAFGIYKGGQ
ncbi:flagellar assembly protein FliH [Candidatus Gastranaerophilus sp. (ex Termes propinquus)]|nr:flagellar assembly protein FliH [Candidatus Gastranaerophilus sp. (ex Termes propinquus)]